MKTRSIVFTALALPLLISFNMPVAAAQEPAAEIRSAEAAAMSSGEVRKIDKEAGKITIKHGPLANLGMPPMTMVFRVSDPALLDQVKPGDKIDFVAEKANGALVVTKIQAAE
ncbi:copper-binding protein [Collimonas fungivorans]|nr:copper-binding protein [Collimonas fungivorans]